jgi:hypothetical protein
MRQIWNAQELADKITAGWARFQTLLQARCSSENRPVCCPDNLIDQVWRRLTAKEVLSHGSDGKLGNQKLGETYLLAALFAKDHPRPTARSSRLYALGHSATRSRNSGGHSPCKKSFRS